MILLIDGYNVLKQALHARDTMQKSKDHFVAQLNKYGKLKRHHIYIVFDGGDTPRDYKEVIGSVTVIHSGFAQSADDWIKKYVTQHKGYDVLLVSTDRELGSFVRKQGATTLDALDFYQLLQEAIGAHGSSERIVTKIVKTTEQNIPELDALMLQESQHAKAKSDDIRENNNERKSNAQTLSKQDRKMLKKLKKL